MNKEYSKLFARMRKIMGSAIPVLMFVNQLLSYSLIIELEQGNIKRIEFAKHNRLIEKIIDPFFSEKNDEEDK